MFESNKIWRHSQQEKECVIKFRLFDMFALEAVCPDVGNTFRVLTSELTHSRDPNAKKAEKEMFVCVLRSGGGDEGLVCWLLSDGKYASR